MTTTSGTHTFLESLVAAIKGASAYNSQDQVPPVAVLWPDKDRQWESLLPTLRKQSPVFALGSYSPEENTGPAYWLRCIIARTISHPSLQADEVPVLYLPGYSRRELRTLEPCPPELEPLAELQYRGILWAQRNGRDWTITAFLQNKDGGLGIEVGTDTATRDALQRSLLKLAEEPVEVLSRDAPLRSPFLDSLLHPDDVKNVLSWINDPAKFRDECTEEEWEAFAAVGQDRYGLDPLKDSPITGAEKLGQQDGNWKIAWRRLAEAPASYRAIPDRLREAKPEKTLPMLDPKESWPQDNESAEASLRTALTQLADLDPKEARRAVINLERDHSGRRAWIWHSLGWSPMAKAIEHLATMAKATEAVPSSTSVPEAVRHYCDSGWIADLAVLDALASVDKSADIEAVQSAVRAVYWPWLRDTVESFQKVVAASESPGYQTASPTEAQNGTCILFTDGLRFDVAQRLASFLSERGIKTEITGGLTAMPSVTATAKPALSPAAAELKGGDDFETVVTNSGSKVDAQILRAEVANQGFQVLNTTNLGDPTSRAWSEFGDIDSQGHAHGWRLSHYISEELNKLAERIANLLEHGWQKVVLVTDHGWLLVPGGLPKAELPEHLTEVRKGRCARLKEGSPSDYQVVPWHWDPTVRVAVAPGIYCYEAGKEYEHGGLSPQECIVPTLTATGNSPAVSIEIETVRWRGLRCNIEVKGAMADAKADIRTRGNDPTTTIAMGGKDLDANGNTFLFVEDEDRQGDPVLIVIVGPDGSVLAHTSTIVGDP